MAVGGACLSGVGPIRAEVTPWPPIEPPELDRIAKYNRSLLHYRVRDLAELRQCLAQTVPVLVVVLIDTRWYSAIGGKIENPDGSLPIQVNHANVA